jgi:hypothetical protein
VVGEVVSADCGLCNEPTEVSDIAFDDVWLHRSCCLSIALFMTRAFEDYQNPERRTEALRLYARAAKALGLAK